MNLYDAALGRWWSVDPLAEKYQGWSGYNYGMDNPVRFVDPDGLEAASPIYDENGSFLGTDDNGLTGDLIVMKADNFSQGMSHEEAINKSLNFEQIETNIQTKITSHFESLPNRPDYDGILTLKEANDWYKNGNGKPLYVDLNKMDLSGVYVDKFSNGVGSKEVFNLDSGSTSGPVYGNITLKLYPNNQVRAYQDKYDFEMHKPLWNPINWGRNLETVIVKKIAGNGTSFKINITGSKYIPYTNPMQK